MAEAAVLQSLASLEYGWVGAEIQDAEMRKVRWDAYRMENGLWDGMV